MKKVFLFAIALMALMSCEKSHVEEKGEKVISFHISGNFARNYEEMSTRASASDAGITDIWVFDYQDGVLVQSVRQADTDSDFGTPQLTLSYGHHDLKVVASKGIAPGISNSMISWTKVLDTFTLDYPLDVVASSDDNLSLSLERAVSGIKLVMTDEVPSNTKSISLSYARSLSLSLPSLIAGEASVSAVTNDIPSSWTGKTGGSFSVYTLCPTDEMITDVHVTVKSADNSVLSDFTIPDVEIRKNRITTLTGEVFSRGSGFSVTINDTWDEGIEVKF